MSGTPGQVLIDTAHYLYQIDDRYDSWVNYLRESLIDPITLEPDYGVFISLMAYEFAQIEKMIDEFPVLADVDSCPDAFLPYLASLVGYEYRHDLSSSDQRLIIRYLTHIYRIRGTHESAKIALRFAGQSELSLVQKTDLSMIQVVETSEPGVWEVQYVEDMSVSLGMLESVRPAGTKYRLVRAVATDSVSMEFDPSFDIFLIHQLDEILAAFFPDFEVVIQNLPEIGYMGNYIWGSPVVILEDILGLRLDDLMDVRGYIDVQIA